MANSCVSPAYIDGTDIFYFFHSVNPHLTPWCRTFRMLVCPVWCPSWHQSLGPPSFWIRSPVTSCWLTHLSMSSNVTCSRFTDTPSNRTRGNSVLAAHGCHLYCRKKIQYHCWLTIFIHTGTLIWPFLIKWTNQSWCTGKCLCSFAFGTFSIRHLEADTCSFTLPEWSLQPLISFLVAALQLIWGLFTMPFRFANITFYFVRSNCILALLPRQQQSTLYVLF